MERPDSYRPDGTEFGDLKRQLARINRTIAEAEMRDEEIPESGARLIASVLTRLDPLGRQVWDIVRHEGRFYLF